MPYVNTHVLYHCYGYGIMNCILLLFVVVQGEEFAAITPKRLQIPAVTASSVVKAKIIRDMDKKPSTDVSELSIRAIRRRQ